MTKALLLVKYQNSSCMFVKALISCLLRTVVNGMIVATFISDPKSWSIKVFLTAQYFPHLGRKIMMSTWSFVHIEMC